MSEPKRRQRLARLPHGRRLSTTSRRSGIFPGRDALIRLVRAVRAEQSDE